MVFVCLFIFGFFLVCFYKNCLLLNNVALFKQDSPLVWVGEWAQLHFGRAVSAFAGKLAPSCGLAGYLLPLFALWCVAVNHFTECCCSFSRGLCLLFPADATTRQCALVISVHWLSRIFATTHIGVFMERRKPESLPVGAGIKLHHVLSLYKPFFCCEIVNLPILCGFPVMIKYLYKYFIL